jgi:hypothetical protein
MKTEREMLTKLKNIAKKINEKTRQFENLHRRQKMASQGNTNFVFGRVNKNTYTNANYMRNVRNAMRIVYDERKPLMNKYNKTAKKYRGILGLPNVGKPGYVRGPPYQWNWQKKNHKSFMRSKSTRNGDPPNVMNLYIQYRNRGATSSSTSGGNHNSVSFGAYYNKFHPNTQLINAVVNRIKAVNTIRGALYRPPKKNGEPGGIGPKGGRLYAKLAAKYAVKN